MPSILHVLNGESTRVTLERAGLPGRLTVWADVLHDGPAPGVRSPEEWRHVRARHLASQGFASEEQIAAQLRVWDDQLGRYADYDEVVFWLEHDLFDQALLIRHLHWVGQTGQRERFQLTSVGAFPGRPQFRGLGELNERELASLFPGRRPVSEAEVEVGSRLWEAFRRPDPRRFADLVLRGDTSALPFAAGAFRRHLEDFPHSGSGLSRTERQMLEAVAAGHTDAAGIFLATQAMEERVYMGDATFWALMRPLVAGRSPLFVHDGEFRSGGAPTGIFELTSAAEDVLAGRADRIALNGIDRWIGGVHLTDGRWRWDGTSVARTAASRRPRRMVDDNSKTEHVDDMNEIVDAGGAGGDVQGEGVDEDAMMEREAAVAGRARPAVARAGRRPAGSRKATPGRPGAGRKTAAGARKAGGGSRKASKAPRKASGARKAAVARKAGARKAAGRAKASKRTAGARKTSRKAARGSRKGTSRKRR